MGVRADATGGRIPGFGLSTGHAAAGVAHGSFLPGTQWLPLDGETMIDGLLSAVIVDANGAATWSVSIPQQPVLVGLALHSCGVVLDLAGPSLFPAITNVASFVVQ